MKSIHLLRYRDVLLCYQKKYTAQKCTTYTLSDAVERQASSYVK